ncbi:integrase [Streptomyces sp. NPDC102270]|uniref:integrase n=1 Tax=Streptomyces sp. NPDC102270 TaxID=3366150 RepID=UPI00380F35CA
MTSPAHDLVLLPGPDTPVIPGHLVVATEPGPIARFGDARWPLLPLIDNPSADRSTILWEPFPPALREELRHLAWQLINRSLPETFVTGRSGAWRTRQSPTGIYQTVLIWRQFASWLTGRGITTLAACTTETFLDYNHGLLDGGGLSRSSVQYRLSALLRLWAFDAEGPAPLGIGEPPWLREGVDDYLPAASGGGENATEPISEATMGPLLVWALRVVEDFSEDILASWRDYQKLKEAGENNASTAEGLAAAKAYLDGLIAHDLPFPTVHHARGRALATTYIAAVTGAATRQVQNAIRRAGRKEHLARSPDIRCPLPTQITGTVAGRPWTDHVNYSEAHMLMRHLGTAAFIVMGYLTGMRTGEVLGLRSGCCPPVASGRHLIYGHVFKTARDEHGNHLSSGMEREVPWVAITPVVKAIRVLERIVPHGALLFDATTHDFARQRKQTGSLKAISFSQRIGDFVPWVNELAKKLGRPHEAVPDDPHGAVVSLRFRRTLAWHIARRPGGLVALAIQYGHMRTTISGGYASRSRDGIHELLDTETAFATADNLAGLHEDLATGGGLSGPAARRALHAATQAPAFAGTTITARQARDLLRNPALAVHDNPHALLLCVYNRDKALCHRLGAHDTPHLDRCVPTCANIARTDLQAEQLIVQAGELEKQAVSPMVPAPLADRLQNKAAGLRHLAEQHDQNRITLQEKPA